MGYCSSLLHLHGCKSINCRWSYLRLLKEEKSSFTFLHAVIHNCSAAPDIRKPLSYEIWQLIYAMGCCFLDSWLLFHPVFILSFGCGRWLAISLSLCRSCCLLYFLNFFFSSLQCQSIFYVCILQCKRKHEKKFKKYKSCLFSSHYSGIILSFSEIPAAIFYLHIFFIIRRISNHSFFVELTFECKNPPISFPRLLRFNPDFRRV